jgi:peptide/nickel transport system substrate-binding protein
VKKLLVPLVIFLTCAFIITGCSTTSTTTPVGATTTNPVLTTQTTTAPVITTSKAPTTVVTTSSVPTTTIKPPSSTAPGNKYGGKIRFIIPAAPSSPIGTPWEAPFGNACQTICLEAMLTPLADSTLLPKLASFEMGYDLVNPSQTFKLIKGVKFHDGTDLNAQVVKWSLQKLIDSHMFASVSYFKPDQLTVVDDYTLKCPMTEWRNSNMPARAMNEGYIVSPTALEKNGLDWMRVNMVGTGPYIQSDYQRDVSLTAKRNPNYWQTGKPYVDEIQYLFVSDSLTQQALFKSGGAEVYDTSGSAMVASQLAAMGYNILSVMSGAYVLLPDSANKESPWSNLKVRQAVEYALDKDSIAKTFGYGYWQGATQAPSPQAPAYVKSITGRKYDVTKAKALLTEAGFPNGFKTKIYAQDNADRNVLIALQSGMAKVGIDASLEVVQAAGMVGIQSSGWSNGVLFIPLGFEGNIIPSMGFNFPPVRTGRYKNVANSPRWEELYRKVATTPTLEVSIEQEVTQDVYDFLMWIPLYWYPRLWATTTTIQDTGLGKLAGDFWTSENAYFTK